MKVLLTMALMLAPQVAERGREPMEPGRTYTEWLYAGRTEDLWDRFSPAMREAFGDSATFGQSAAPVRALVPETALLEERSWAFFPLFFYVRHARFSGSTSLIEVEWVLGGDGTIEGLLVSAVPATADTRFADYQTRTPLRLPFSGEWMVFWGGDPIVENYHAVARDQRFAYDVMAVERGRLFEKDGSHNEDWYCFGRPILAPADGVVVEAVDGVAENAPGQTGSGHAGGNRVVLDHGNGEYSFLAHLMRGSVQVAGGQRVSTGQELGRCGNSGNSTAPHLHYHLQNTPIWFAGEGLPAQFLDYVADAMIVERGEPVRGQIIAAVEEEPPAGTQDRSGPDSLERSVHPRRVPRP